MRNSGLIHKDPWSKCLRAQHGRGERGMCSPAQWTSGQTLHVFKPQHLVQSSVWPGPWCGERGWLCTYCWPEPPWMIIYFRLEFPGDHKALPRARLPRAWCLGLHHHWKLSIKDQAVPDSSLVGHRTWASY